MKIKRTIIVAIGAGALQFAGFVVSPSIAAAPSGDPHFQKLQQCVATVAQGGGSAAIQAMAPWANMATALDSCQSVLNKVKPAATPAQASVQAKSSAPATPSEPKSVQALAGELGKKVSHEAATKCRARDPRAHKACLLNIEKLNKVPPLPDCNLRGLGPKIYCGTVYPAMEKCRFIKPVSEKEFAACMTASLTEAQPRELSSAQCANIFQQGCIIHNAKVGACKGKKGPELERCLGPD